MTMTNEAKRDASASGATTGEGATSGLEHERQRPEGLEALLRASEAQLEQLYCRDLGEVAVPRGLYRGVHLRSLHNRGSERRWLRWAEWLGFELLPFGVDFDSGAWFFVRPTLQIGRFDGVVAPSRWRAARVVTLRYERSRLPRVLRRLLYDEVKPLSDTLCLGLGGVDGERGLGDQFYFALVRVPRVGLG